MFGIEASYPARRAADLFKEEGKSRVLELGAGQGRDTFFLAQSGFHVTALDYSESGVKAIAQKARELRLSSSIRALCHDVREPLPFEDGSFDACYSHMLYCMALTTPQLEFLSQEVRRVLRPHGLNVYTVRNTRDPCYRTGTHRGEDMYEVEGFVIHFFSKERVESLARGFQIVGIEEFEEGSLPKRLFLVTLRRGR